MKNYKLNFIIDALMFILMMALAGQGFLLEYVLVPGREVLKKYGINADPYFWGLKRETWGEIHLILAYILLALLVLHIILHWKAICVFFEKTVLQPVSRKIFASVFVIVNLFLLTFFLIFKPELREFERGLGRGRNFSNLIQPDAALKHEPAVEMQDKTEEIQEPVEIKQDNRTKVPSGLHQETAQQSHNKQLDMVRGMYTLGEVAETYGVPADHIKEKLGLPSGTSSQEKLGTLRKRYGFRMSDLERIILEYKKANN